MGLLDQIDAASGMFGGEGSGAGAQGGAVGAIMQTLQGHPGGIAGVISSFKQERIIFDTFC